MPKTYGNWTLSRECVLTSRCKIIWDKLLDQHKPQEISLTAWYVTRCILQIVKFYYTRLDSGHANPPPIRPLGDPTTAGKRYRLRPGATNPSVFWLNLFRVTTLSALALLS